MPQRHALVGRFPKRRQIARQRIVDRLDDTVVNRGAAIIAARGASSAASAAAAAVDHMADWWKGTNGAWASMAIPSKGEYGVPEGLIFSYPCTVDNGVYSVVEGIEHNDFAKARIQATVDELLSEREAVKDLLV